MGVSAPAFLFLLFFITILAACILTIKYLYYIPPAIICISILIYSLRNILLGICIIIFFYVLILVQTLEITPVEVIFFIYLVILILSWFFQRIMVRKVHIIKEKSDYFLITFIAIAFLSFFPALISRLNMIHWFRELIPFITFFLYFMVKTEVKNKRDIVFILLSLFSVSLYFSVSNIINFGKLLSNIQYFWEIASSRQVLSEIFFTMSLILGLSFLFSSIPKKIKPFLIIFIMITSVSLALTFSRGYWIASIFGTFVLFILANKEEKLNFLKYLGVFTFISVTFVSFYFGNLTEFVGISLMERFPSLKDIFSDISILNRLSETKGIFQSIKYYFIAGAGLGAKFKYFNIIDYETVNTWYSHNAFLYLLFKLGIPGLIIYLLFYFSIIRYCIFFLRIKSNTIENSIAKGTAALLISMFFLSVSSPQFYQKDSVLIVAVLGGLIVNFRERYKLLKGKNVIDNK